MRVIIESPFGGRHRERNIDYARRCLRDSLDRGEAPFASHLLYTQVLDDERVRERRLGLSRAIDWYDSAELIAIYLDHGVTPGMRHGMDYARKIGLDRESRWLDK